MKVNMTNALILDDKGRVLLIHNCKKGSDRWEFPGGKVESEDEGNLEETTKRELKEEVGVDIRITGIAGDYKTSTPEGEFLCRTYLAEITSGTPRIAEQRKHDSLGYFSYAQLERLKEDGTLVPILVSMLPHLRRIVS